MSLISRSREGVADQLAHARQEFRAHARMEAVTIDAAERQQPRRRIARQRDQRYRADVDGVTAEQELLLTVPDLTAARFRCYRTAPSRP